MKVQLIDYTGYGHPDPARHAANVLVFTKQTRLTMVPGLMAEIESWDDDEINDQLEYMSRTIPSSWEFINYSFLITGVTRGFTHQFVRTRTGHYAQQTMRVLDVEGWEYGTGPTIEGDVDKELIYAGGMSFIDNTYRTLIEMGANIEDARGILPTNIKTNIAAGFNLRTVCDLVRKRSSSRTQGEYRDVLEAMKAEVLRVHPWAAMFINRSFDVAAAELQSKIEGLGLTREQTVDLLKLVDQMRGTA